MLDELYVLFVVGFHLEHIRISLSFQAGQLNSVFLAELLNVVGCHVARIYFDGAVFC